MTKLNAKKINYEIDRNIAILNTQTLSDLKIKHSANIKIKSDKGEIMCEVLGSDTLIVTETTNGTMIINIEFN